MRPRRYRVAIEEELDDEFAASFEGMSLSREDGQTILTGTVRDQAHLQALLLTASRLGLSIDSVAGEERNDG